MRESLSRLRPTREESRQRTRALLIESARRHFAEVGIANSTIRRIAEAAGFTLGAFYSNFESKDEVVVALMEMELAGLTKGFREVVQNLDFRDHDRCLVELAQWLKSLHDDEIRSRLLPALHLYAAQNPAFAAQFARRRKRYIKEFADALEQFYARSATRPQITPLQLATGFVALWNGFSIQRADSDPGINGDVYLAFMRAFFAAPRRRSAA